MRTIVFARLLAVCAWVLAGMGWSSISLGQVSVILTTPTRIEATQTTIQTPSGTVPLADVELTVRGTTLTINGTHTLRSLTVEGASDVAGVVTHDPGFQDGMRLTMGVLTIEASGRIDLNGAGYPSGQGYGAGWVVPGLGAQGGSHAGIGAPESNPQLPRSYGLFPGSGGGAFNGVPGGRGGGVVSIVASQAARIDGSIEANGLAGSAMSGSGAGGYIRIQSPRIDGTGQLQVNGGGGPNSFGGGGGGIELIASREAITVSTQTHGGASPAGQQQGGAGYVLVGPSGPTNQYDVIIDGGTPGPRASTPYPFVSELGNLTIRSAFVTGRSLFRTVQGTCLLDGSVTLWPFVLNVAGRLHLRGEGNEIRSYDRTIPLGINVSELLIDAGSIIHANGLSPNTQSSPSAGRPPAGGFAATGAGSRGMGGGFLSGPSAGGSGGGAGSGFSGGAFAPDVPGGAGGAYLNIRVTGQPGTLVCNGTISSDGLPASGGAGGGSGGFVDITAVQVLGAGLFSARGGSTTGRGGSGGGGQVSIIGDTSGFTGQLSTAGGATDGSDFPRGGAGIATTTLPSSPYNALLLVDGESEARVNPTQVRLLPAFGTDIVVKRGAQLELQNNTPFLGSFSVIEGATCALSSLYRSLEGDLIVEGEGSRLQLLSPGNLMNFTVSGNVRVGQGAMVSVDGAGFAATQGPGAGQSATGDGQGGAGGSHGGRGASAGNAASGMTYGDPLAPITAGSGGGNGSGPLPLNAGGSGGGIIQIDALGDMVIDGVVSSSGVASAGSGGGGAGGTISLRSPRISGSGVIRADGGAAGGGVWGAGGGGRVLLRSCDLQFPLERVSVAPGETSGTPAEAGSVRVGTSFVTTISPNGTRNVRRDTDVVFTVQTPTGASVQWRRRNADGIFVPIIDDGRIQGSTTRMLQINDSTCTDAGSYDCVITDSCGTFVAPAVVLNVRSPADSNFDGSVDSDDVTYFLTRWDLGQFGADANSDGRVDADDVIEFFTSWDAGC